MKTHTADELYCYGTRELIELIIQLEAELYKLKQK